MALSFVSLHILAGSVALLLYWAALLQRKGSRPHRRFGRLFLLALAAVLATISAFLLGPHRFAAPELVQFAYLSLCLITVALTGFLAIRLRRDLERFRGPWFQ